MEIILESINNKLDILILMQNEIIELNSKITYIDTTLKIITVFTILIFAYRFINLKGWGKNV